MECHCKRDGVPVWCDIDKPLCGKAKISARIEHFIMDDCIGGIVSILTVAIMVAILGGVIAGLAWCFNHLK